MNLACKSHWLFTDTQPDHEKLKSFIQDYGFRLLDPVKSEIEKSLLSPCATTRFMAAVNMQMHIAHGVDTASACKLGDILLNHLEENWQSISLTFKQNPTTVLAITLSTWIYASKQEGNWHRLLDRWQSAAKLEPKLHKEQHYWNSGCHVATTLLRRNDLKSTEAFINTFPKHLQHLTPQFESLINQYTIFSKGRFELDSKPTTDEAARSIWERDLESSAETLSQLYNTTQNQPITTLGWDVSKLPALVNELRKQKEIATSNLPFEEKYRSLTQRTYKWRKSLRDFLSPGRDPEHVNNEWVEDCLTRAAMIQADAVNPATLKTVADIVIKDIGKSLKWSRRAGDVHTIWMLRWCASIIYEKLEIPFRRLRALNRLGLSLRSKSLDTDDPNLCSLVAHFFSGFAEKLTKSSDCLSHPNLMINAFELRRGRALIAARADIQTTHQFKHNQLPTLGSNTHYLGYTVFYERQKIFAQLISADGTISTHTISINWNELLNATCRLDPANWNKRNRFQPTKQPLWLTLTALLEPLAIALTNQRIAVNDHICISAEDPIHLIPLHALPCNNTPLFRLFSISRVASYSDAAKLSSENFERPTNATALFIDAQHKNPSWRRSHFNQTTKTLQSLNLTVDDISPKWMTSSELLSHLTPNRIIHLHAHGHFPEDRNPQTNSGIVVSDGLGLPRLDGNLRCLCTPETVLAFSPNLTSSHLTLSTCVSGKGLPGKYGDALGLEMALRWSGASSLLATHWDVRSDDAMIFCDYFYRAWIIDGLSRGRAWQLAIQSLADPDAPIDCQARWCAFSLFGGWT